MRIYLAGNTSTKNQINLAIYEASLGKGKDMKLFLAGTAPRKNEGLYDPAIRKHRPYILESFFMQIRTPKD